MREHRTKLGDLSERARALAASLEQGRLELGTLLDEFGVLTNRISLKQGQIDRIARELKALTADADAERLKLRGDARRAGR